MFSRIITQKLNRCNAYRYILLIISVCIAFNVFAQQNYSQNINDIIVSKNIEDGKILLQQINESDIKNMSDSTLLDYYYLAGVVAMENNETEKQIEYLEKAKEICETKLGINNNIFVYFEIIKALGKACEDSDKKDEALLWYEEGIVKGIPYLKINDTTLQSYFYDIFNNLADIYEEREYNGIAEYLRRNKMLGEYISSFDYAYELLMKAMQLYNEHQCNEAINLLDEAKDIFRKHGDKGDEMMQPLYRLYLLCYAQMADSKKIDKLLRTKGKIMFYSNESESYLVNDMYTVIATFIIDHYDVNTAEYYYQRLLKNVDKNNYNDLNEVEAIGNQISYFKNIYFQIDSLENEKKLVSMLSYEWGIYSLLQSNLLIRIQRYDDANNICEQIYKMSVLLKEDPQNLHWFVLMNLADYHNQNKNLGKTEQYLKEQLTWLDSKNIPSNAEERGWVYNKLGIAYLNGKLYKESGNMLIKAEKILLPIYGHQSQEYATILHNKGRLAQLEDKFDEAKKYLEEAIKIQIKLDGKAMDRTTQYLDEVNHAINVRL